jgi:hypothetical protein
MAWTAPKIQALLLRTPAPKPAANLKVMTVNRPSRQPSPRGMSAGTKSSYPLRPNGNR